MSDDRSQAIQREPSGPPRVADAGRPAMPVGDALSILAALRRDEIVVTNQGSAREWPKHSQHDLDFHFIPSAMGGAVPLGLGLALARPKRPVWVFTGDGSLLMNLGCLVTVAAAGATNLSILLLDNGIYEVTGGQRTAASAATDLAGFARAAGLATVAEYSDAATWHAQAAKFLARPGPRFVSLRVDPVRENFLLDPPCPISEQLARLRCALGT